MKSLHYFSGLALNWCFLGGSFPRVCDVNILTLMLLSAFLYTFHTSAPPFYVVKLTQYGINYYLTFLSCIYVGIVILRVRVQEICGQLHQISG